VFIKGVLEARMQSILQTFNTRIYTQNVNMNTINLFLRSYASVQKFGVNKIELFLIKCDNKYISKIINTISMKNIYCSF